MVRIDNLDNTFSELAVLNAAITFAAQNDDKETGADLLLRIRDVSKAVKKLEDGAKAIFDDVKTDKTFSVEGLVCLLQVNQKVDWRFKTADVKAEMGEAWWNKRCGQAISNRLLTSAIK